MSKKVVLGAGFALIIGLILGFFVSFNMTQPVIFAMGDELITAYEELDEAASTIAELEAQIDELDTYLGNAIKTAEDALEANQRVAEENRELIEAYYTLEQEYVQLLQDYDELLEGLPELTMSVSLSGDPATIVADWGVTTTITVKVTSDFDGSALSGANVTLRTRGGRFEGPNTYVITGLTGSNGVFTAVWATPDPRGFIKPTEYVFTATVSKPGYVSGEGTTTVIVHPMEED